MMTTPPPNSPPDARDAALRPPGQCVIWRRQLRGGWGYTVLVPAIVLRAHATGSRYSILTLANNHANNGAPVTVRRVTAAALRDADDAIRFDSIPPRTYADIWNLLGIEYEQRTS